MKAESPNFDVDEPTLDDQEDPSVVGEFTEQLSECSNTDDVRGSSTFSSMITMLSHLTGSFYHADASNNHDNSKQLQKHQVFLECMQILADFRWLTLYLFFALAFCMLGLSVIKFCVLSFEYHETYGKYNHCIYEWAEWSACSATCSTDEVQAQRYRRVSTSTVIDMRDIPSDISKIMVPHRVLKSLGNSDCFDIMQYSPCNVYKCPKPFTEFNEWGPCKHQLTLIGISYVEVCVRYRIIEELALVLMNNYTAPLMKSCSCSEVDTPW